MGLETGTFVADLVPTNPLNADLESQGAAHLRLIKQTLQNTFPRGSRAVAIPTPVVKSASYTVVNADVNSIFLIDTTAAIVNLTLPTLASVDAGWEISVIKTNTGLNPVLIKPPSGTLSSGPLTGLSATRRCVPNVPSRVIWTGTAFICTRAVLEPVGSCIEYHGTALPVGFELPNGQTLASAATNYPDYNLAIGSGVTLDRTGRVAAMKESVAGGSRLTNAGSGIAGDTIGAAGGIQAVTINSSGSFTLLQSDLPNISPTWTQGAAGSQTAPIAPGSFNLASGATNITPLTAGGSTSGIVVTGTISSINGGVTQTAHIVNSSAPNVADVQPTIVTNLLLVVE